MMVLILSAKKIWHSIFGNESEIGLEAERRSSSQMWFRFIPSPSLLAFLESKSKKTTIKMKKRRMQMNKVDVEPLIRFILRASWANTVAIENDLANEWIQSLKFFRVNGSARSFFGPFCLLREKPILGGQRPASNKCKYKYKYRNEIHIFASCGRS